MPAALITACSKRKLPYSAPAGEVNQGQFFRGVRKFAAARGFDLYIISAKYGLIPASHLIAPYDQRLRTKVDVARIQEPSLPLMHEIAAIYDHVWILAGALYSSVVAPLRAYSHITWFYDRQGSGGFNRLIVRLNTCSPMVIEKLLAAKLTAVNHEIVEAFQQIPSPTPSPL